MEHENNQQFPNLKLHTLLHSTAINVHRKLFKSRKSRRVRRLKFFGRCLLGHKEPRKRFASNLHQLQYDWWNAIKSACPPFCISNQTEARKSAWNLQRNYIRCKKGRRVDAFGWADRGWRSGTRLYQFSC